MPLVSDLTTRQIDTLELIAKGFSNKEIAKLLNISVNTVKAHIAAVLQALQASNRTEAVFNYQQLIREMETTDLDPTQVNSSPNESLDKVAIAVIPFTNMTQEADHNHLGEGFAEELSIRIACLRWLPVIAFSSCRGYSCADDLSDIARKLNVTYILTGSVRWISDQVCITVELINRDNPIAVWSARYQYDDNDMLGTLDLIATEMAAGLDFEVVKDQSLPKGLKSGDCWEQAMRGLWHLSHRRLNHSEKALERFERCIELEPNWALSYYGRAMARYQQWFEQWCQDREQHLILIEEDANRCIQSDPQLANGHLVYALVQIAKGQMMVAVQSLQHALSLNPSLAHAYGLLGQICGMAGQDKEAIKHLNNALQLNPRDPSRWTYFAALSMVHLSTQNYSESIKYAGEAIAFGCESAVPHIALIACYIALNEIAQAEVAKQHFKQRHPDFKLEGLKNMLKGARPDLVELLFDHLATAGIKD